MYGLKQIKPSVRTHLTFGTVTMHFENYFSTILFKNANLNFKKKKEKETQVVQNFGPVRKGQTDILF